MTGKVRSVRSDARDNRRLILKTAGEIFADDGLDVPIREIARRAGVGIATVYRHFPSKDDLLAEVFRGQLVSCRLLIESGLEADDPWEGLKRVLQELMIAQASDRGFARAFTSRHIEAPSFSTERDHSLRLMRDLVERARSASSLRADVTMDDILLALMANGGIRAERSATRVAAARRLSALLLRSFSARPENAAMPPSVALPLPRPN